MMKLFRNYDTTQPVAAFIIDQLMAKDMLLAYESYSLREMMNAIKKEYKPKMDPWIYRRADWLEVAERIKVKIDEYEK